MNQNSHDTKLRNEANKPNMLEAFKAPFIEKEGQKTSAQKNALIVFKFGHGGGFSKSGSSSDDFSSAA